MKTDIEIARAATKLPIARIAERLGIGADEILPYGHDKAKISRDFIDGLRYRPEGKLVLVTATNPTPAGEGKTTTTVGLGDALNRIGQRATVCIREASLGPNFGMKGGAAGGGRAVVEPPEHGRDSFSAMRGPAGCETVAPRLLSPPIPPRSRAFPREAGRTPRGECMPGFRERRVAPDAE